MTYRTLVVTNKQTGESIQHRNYTESDEESKRLARLTWSDRLWDIKLSEESNTIKPEPEEMDQLALLLQ